MSEQDPTALEPSPTPAPTDSPEPAATLEPASLQTQEQPGGEPAQVEGGEGGAQKTEPTAWASIPEPADVLEHESFKPLVEERVATAREVAKKEGHSEAHSRRQTLFEREAGEIQGAKEIADRFVTTWERLARTKDEAGQPAVDPARLQDLLDDNKGVFSKLSEIINSDAHWVGAQKLVNTLAQAMNAPDFATKFVPRVDRFRRDVEDAGLWTDMVEAIADSAKKPLQEQLKEKDAKITRLETEVREAKRNGQPSPANPPGGGGGAGKTKAEEDEILMNPGTDINVIKEIWARRKG